STSVTTSVHLFVFLLSPILLLLPSFLFLFTHTAPTPIYTLSLHDALPISEDLRATRRRRRRQATWSRSCSRSGGSRWSANPHSRSEEHTSELQSRGHLVCRLLLEKKKKQK